MGHARLRTKTGCFTCRRRRVKCGEERPCCRNCSNNSHDCTWPTSRDLCDRRNLSKAGQQCSPPTSTSGALALRTPSPAESWIGLGLNSPGGTGIECEDDVDLIYHFLNNFISVLVLPTWNRKNLVEYESELVSMMMHSEGVKCAVLAACAANKYILSNNNRYERLALVYYSRAVGHVNRELDKLCSPDQAPPDSLVTTVVYLYLHDIWGLDAAFDPRRHVAGAIKLLHMKYDRASRQPPQQRTFELFTIESIVYQAFLLAARRPFAPNFSIDTDFLTLVQEMLDSPINTDLQSPETSPILGATRLLYRFIIDIINHHSAGKTDGVNETLRLKAEMRQWEAKLLNEYSQDCSLPQETSFYTNTLSLYILAASLLLDWVIDSASSSSHTGPEGFLTELITPGACDTRRRATMHRWQVTRALAILRQPGARETWSSCYLGTWPLLILGYAVDADDDIAVIRRVFSYARHRMGYGENQRILSELEGVWSARGNRNHGAPIDVTS